jgi:hypothetical protein
MIIVRDIKEIKRTNNNLLFFTIILICLVLYYLYVDNEIRVMLAKTTRSLAGELMCMRNKTHVLTRPSESN